MDIEIISKALNLMIMFLQYKYNTAGLTRCIQWFIVEYTFKSWY